MANKFLILHHSNRLEVYEDSEVTKMLDKVRSMTTGKQLNNDDRKFAAKLIDGDFSQLERKDDLGRYQFRVMGQFVTLYRGYRGE